MLVSYRSGDMWAPRLDATEALQTEALHFIDCIENNKQPETDGQAGLRLVRSSKRRKNLCAQKANSWKFNEASGN